MNVTKRGVGEVTYTAKGLEVEMCFLVWRVQGSGLTSEVKVPVEAETEGEAICWELMDLPLGSCCIKNGVVTTTHCNYKTTTQIGREFGNFGSDSRWSCVSCSETEPGQELNYRALLLSRKLQLM